MTIWPTLLQVFGLSWALISIGMLQGVSGSDTSQCGFQNNVHCLAGAECVGIRQCRCEQGGEDGTFYCPEDPNEQRVELVGPQNNLQAWNHSLEAPLTLECRARLTEITVERPVDQRVCTFQIFGQNKVVANKVLLETVELHLKVEEFGEVKYQRAFQLSPGTFTQNVYTYKERTKTTFQDEEAETFTELPDNELINSGSGMGEFLDDEFDEMNDNPTEDDEDSASLWGPVSVLSTADQNDGVVRRSVDDNNVAVMTIAQCAMEIRFRAPDSALMSSGLYPGLAIVLDPEATNVQFSEPGTYLAGSPTADLNSYLREAHHLTQTEVYLHTALEYAAVQGDDTLGETCKDTGFVYRAYCTTESKKMKALKACSPLLSDWSKRACLTHSEAHNGALHAFKRCMWISCTPTVNVCSLFRKEFEDEACLTQEEKDAIFKDCPVTS